VRRPPVGAHVPVGAGLARQGLAYARRIGAEAVQVFVSNPRAWAASAGDPRQDEAFRAGCSADGIAVFVHAPYLINLGSPTPATLERSVSSLAAALERGRAVGARGVVVHAGSAVAGGTRTRAFAQVREHLLPLLDGLDDGGPALLVEPTAGGGVPLASAVDDLGPYLANLDDHPRLGVCFDTCHAYAAGEDLTAPRGVRRILDRLVRVAGRGRLQLVHANDSRDPLGSGRDRHERIGRGTLGLAVFADLLSHPAVRRAAVVLETPGEEPGHAEDLRLLRELRDGGAGGRRARNDPDGPWRRWPPAPTLRGC